MCAANVEPDGTSCGANICAAQQCLEGSCITDNVAGCPLFPLSPVAGGEFGTAIALSAKYLVVGAPAPEGSGSGRVHVFLASDEGYSEQTQTTPVPLPFTDANDAAGDFRFGASVDVDGDTIIVGAPFDVVAVGDNESSGSASVFFWNGTAWVFQAKLVDSSGLCSQLGADVAISGDSAALGAPGGDCVLVFERAGSDWSLAADLHAAAAGARFGQSVDVSGDRILVGAPGAATESGCSAQGSVHAFVRGDSAWSLDDTIDEPVEDGGPACFGAALALDGNAGVVGAPRDDTAASDAGAAYILGQSGSQWEIASQLIAIPEGAAGDGFGSTVAMHDGVVIVGAPGVASYLFQNAVPLQSSLRAATTWSFVREVSPPPDRPAASGRFGFSVAIASGKIAVGAPGEQANDLAGAGAVFPGVSISVPADVCGDGVTTSEEDCDDGDTNWQQGESCNAECHALDCGDPNDSGTRTAGDALFALRSAVGVTTCDLSVCDASGNGTVAASDALLILRKAVGGSVTLACPAAAAQN